MDKESVIDIVRALLIALIAIAAFIGWFWRTLREQRLFFAHGPQRADFRYSVAIRVI
jgi:hypothetical protein